jgi:cytochrome c-type biogenesis protein CcmH
MSMQRAKFRQGIETRSRTKDARRFAKDCMSKCDAGSRSHETPIGFPSRFFARPWRAFALKTLLLFAVTFLAAPLALAQSAELARPDPKVESRLKDLAEELRCLVCQNQTIADSNAPLAVDLRNQIRTQIAQGASDDQIRDYMVQRYGDFVLYKPPFKASTALLWVGPFVLVLAGLGGLAVMVRRKRPEAKEVKPGRRKELEKLLDEEA